MPATWLDIVDTAVKIELGAAISGVATFAVTKYKYQSDKELASAQRRRESLDQIAEHTEEFSHICLNYWARILDWTRKKKSGKKVNETIESDAIWLPIRGLVSNRWSWMGAAKPVLEGYVRRVVCRDLIEGP